MSRSALELLRPTEDSLGKWLARPGYREVLAVVLHHTSVPTAQGYQGRGTIEAIRRYHKQKRGWSDIGANGYATPGGEIVTARPLDEDNWAHAYVSREKPEKEAWALCGHDRNWYNAHAFGLEVVADFDHENPHGTGPAADSYLTALQTLVVVHRHFDLPVTRLMFHCDVASKSCPGSMLNRARVRAVLAEMLGKGDTYGIRVQWGGVDIDCSPGWSGGQITVLAVPVLKAVGGSRAQAEHAIHRNGRAYLRELIECAATDLIVTYRDTKQGPLVKILEGLG